MEEKHWNRLAKNYHDEVVSPFFGNVGNPLIYELKKIEGKKDKVVAEFGCGLFYLGKSLSKFFKKVHASDFACSMVEEAKKNNDFLNTKIIQEDIREITYKEKFDVIISVNSIIMPSWKDIKKSFENINNALKKDGEIFLILPSMESVLYHGMLITDKEMGEKVSSSAIRVAKVKAEKRKYDFFLGLYKDGSDIQKFFYEHEVRFLLEKTGFEDIKISKVKYPWGDDISDYEDFPKEMPLWDWFIKAKK